MRKLQKKMFEASRSWFMRFKEEAISITPKCKVNQQGPMKNLQQVIQKFWLRSLNEGDYTVIDFQCN